MNNKHTHETQQRITISFGYALFILAVVAAVMNAVHWGSQLATPGAQRFTVFMMLVSFLAAAIIPPVVGYVTGDKATRAASKLRHQYNGVLFGILGMWLSLVFSSIISFFDMIGATSFSATVVGSYLPVLLAVMSLVTMGYSYRRSQHQHSLVGYRPYQAVFVSVIAGLVVASAWTTASGISYGADYASSFAVLLLPLVMAIGVVVFGAWVIGRRNGSWSQRLMKILIVISFATIAVSVASFLSVLLPIPLVATISLAAGVVTWGVWVIIYRRFPSIEA